MCTNFYLLVCEKYLLCYILVMHMCIVCVFICAFAVTNSLNLSLFIS